jgi:SanA protein
MAWRKIGRAGVWVAAVLLFLLLGSNLWVVGSTRNRVFSDVDALPVNNVAVVLGTSNKLINGTPNPFFENRIKMAATLYATGKVRHLIVSGDNRTRYYNEPLEMKKALVKSGVPDSVITLDYAGLRTLDSIVRCKEIFGQNTITIVTQPFHCYRALFISRYYNMNAVAVMAQEPVLETNVYFREYFARAKAILDLYVLKTAPRHLGQRETLDI